MSAEYRDPKTGKVFRVATGLDNRFWGLFEVKPSGSLRRIKPVDMDKSRESVEAAADEYAVKKGWERCVK